MNEQPEALRLAELVDHGSDSTILEEEVAAELRRLHAENERLHQINQSHEMKLSVRGYEIQIEDLRLAHAELRERNAELLEALKELDSWLVCACIATPEDMAQSFPHMQQVVSAAIAKAEGEQA